MATLTGFFSLVGTTLKEDILSICQYLKELYNNGDVDYASMLTLLVVVCFSTFSFIMFPRTIIVVCFIIWRLYVHVSNDDEDNDNN